MSTLRTPPLLRRPENRFTALPWRSMRWLDPDELRALEDLVEPFVLARGERLVGDEPAPGLFFVVQGAISASTRMPTGFTGEGLLFGRGSVWGEDAYDPRATVPMVVEAVRDTSGWLLRKERFSEAFRRVPDLLRGLLRLGQLRQGYVAFINALRRDTRFATACIPALVSLVAEADVQNFSAGAVVCKAGERLDGLRLLLRGALQSTTHHGEKEHHELLPAGAVFGGLIGGEVAAEPATVTALADSVVVLIPLAVLEERLSSSRGLRRVARVIPALEMANATAVEVVAVVADKKWPAEVFCEMLAQSLLELYQDEVAVMRVLPPGGRARPPEQGPDGVVRTSFVLPRSGRLEAFDRACKALRPAEFVFVDVSAVGPEVLLDLEPAVARLACFTTDTFAPPPVPFPADKIRWTVNVGEVRIAGEPAYQPATVRVRFDPRRLVGVRSRGELDPADAERFARWARGLSERTVGVALGGGGAWGFAHVTLLEGMRRKGIPIDMISGASFGSVAGAWYCTHVDQGFEGLFEITGAANRAVASAWLSSRSIERFVRRHISDARLEDLEVPLFPVATDVGASREYVLTAGTLAFGVRASSSFPGIFAPTTLPGGLRLVDGGIIRNVPIDPLVHQGADLIVASNIVPRPARDRDRPPRLPGKVGRALHELNPRDRLDDLVRSSFILMHTAGEAVAWTADVVYTSDPVRHLPANFENGRLIAEAARESVERDLPAIAARWAVVAATGDRL